MKDLTDKEQRIVYECLEAAVEGPFFPEEEFHTLFGLERDTVRRILEAWPVDDERDETATLAINNAMNNLLGYPHGCREQWDEFISAPPVKVRAVYQKWKSQSANTYVGNLM